MRDDLEDINCSFNNVWIFDDLMDEAVESPVMSLLFRRGRHRNLSVILLLQNMFPKGKYNTNISRNAQYVVLFRSPSDRKQMDILAQRIFAKDRPKFMEAFVKETAKPYGYMIKDNHPQTSNEHQVVADVFDNCKCYPNITTSTNTKELPVPEREKCKPERVSRKRPIIQEQVQSKRRKLTEKKQVKRKSVKPRVYKPKFIVTPTKEYPTTGDQSEFTSDEEQSEFSYDKGQLNFVPRRRGFRPRIVYE